MYFWTCGLPKTWLDKRLKSPVSEHPLTSQMVNGPKHCWNLNGSIFTIFIGHCEGKSVGEILSWWYAKYSDCFLTHWLPKTSILFLKERSYCNIFRCNYFRNRNIFLNFWCIVEVWTQFFKIFIKKMPLIAYVLFNLRTLKNVIR